MSYQYINLNPANKKVGDCAIRAIAIAEEAFWDDIFLKLSAIAFEIKDVKISNHVWQLYLIRHGYQKFLIPNTCPLCYTISDFCIDHPIGTYILGTGSHVVTVHNGDYYDTWDSGEEVPIYFWSKGD